MEYYTKDSNLKILGSKIYKNNNMNKVESMGCKINKYDLTTSMNNQSNLIDYLPGTSLFFHTKIIKIIGIK